MLYKKIRRACLPGQLSAVVLLAVLTGCSIQPWVKPYERANLADPIMKLSRDPISDSYSNHVFQSRESMRGAEGGQGGGCGCN